MRTVVFSPGWEEDEGDGGAHEGDRAVAAQREAAAEGEGVPAEGSGQLKKKDSVMENWFVPDGLELYSDVPVLMWCPHVENLQKTFLTEQIGFLQEKTCLDKSLSLQNNLGNN